jgi:PIN domain nuclease of toxin-antitoxin system
LNTLLSLEKLHKDPFDRLLIAQAITENLTLISIDAQFAAYPVPVIW